MVKCNKCGNSGCNSCNPTVSGGYRNGVLTISVGTSSTVIPLSPESIETRIPVKQEFQVGSGNSLILSDTPLLDLGIDILRNGLLLFSTEYSINNKTITFTVGFGNSTGATGLETIIVNYYK